MFQINRIKLDIQASQPYKGVIEEHFGFDISFNKGLNVIKGENTCGKSTTFACIYFGLGMEELLGGKGSIALDKSLRNEFVINTEVYDVYSSVVYMEVQNINGKIVTLIRYIKGKDDSVIEVINDHMLNIAENQKSDIYYVHRTKNEHYNINFNKWLANFIGIDNLPLVLNYDSNEVPLYLQIIFSALFIEQTKGWSDFLGSMPNFQIKDNKQRAIEFLLSLKALEKEVEKDKIEKEKKKVVKEWAMICNNMEALAKYNLVKLDNIFQQYKESPLKDIKLIDKLTIKVFSNLNISNYLTIDEYIEEKMKEYKLSESTPRIISNNVDLQKTLYLKLGNLNEYRESEKTFLMELNAQEYQLVGYQSHLKKIKKELDANKDIKALKQMDSSINNFDICPTCNQTIDINLVSKNIDIQLKTIDGNIKYLENQKILLESSVQNLLLTLEEKRLISKYFQKEISQLEDEIKTLQTELCDPLGMPSRTQIYQQMLIQQEIKRAEYIKKSFDELKNSLKRLSEVFNNIEFALSKVSEQVLNDGLILKKFEDTFKDLLFSFGYTSNSVSSISIQTKQPSKYFPTIKLSKSDNPKIQMSSSASDFIRSNWAYTIALLLNGKNHPGMLLIDEPSQHAMKSNSLKVFFQKLSSLNEYQIIVAASTEPKEKMRTEDGLTYNLDEILENIPHNSIFIDKKAIRKMS